MLKTNTNKGSDDNSIFNYERSINYFLTIFFVFVLMIFLLLIIGLSREVLSDNDVEKHVLKTKNLIDELEKVEEDSLSYENISLNISDYYSYQLVNRLDVLTSNTDTNEVPLNSILYFNHLIKVFNDSIIVIADLNPIIGDYVLVEIENELIKGVVIDIEETGNLILVSNDYNSNSLSRVNTLDNKKNILKVDLVQYRGVIVGK